MKPFIYLVVLLTTLIACHRMTNEPVLEIAESGLDRILESGKIVVATEYNSTNYFVYRGQPMGFQFDLLQDFSDYMGLKLEVIVSHNPADNFKKLEAGEVDIIASNITVTKDRKRVVDFTIPHSQSSQVLVQRKPDGWERLGRNYSEEFLLRNQADLAGKTVIVPRNSSFGLRLRNLANEIGDTIYIVEVDQSVESLIARVSAGDIAFTVADEHVANVYAAYYENLDINTKVSFPQNFAWAVKKGDTALRDVVNLWLSDFKNTRRFTATYNRYFNNQRTAQMIGCEYFALKSGVISKYDKTIKKYSREINWDWRLVASLIYQESRFNPEAVSWAGAFGLMQLMPNTASRMGVDASDSPEAQIKAGIELIKWLEDRFINIEDRRERIKFVLAAYNVGIGHVTDAQKLAARDGFDPIKWDDSVDIYILKKSQPEYYNDPLVKYGYCRGMETFNYVSQVITRFNHYLNIVKY